MLMQEVLVEQGLGHGVAVAGEHLRVEGHHGDFFKHDGIADGIHAVRSPAERAVVLDENSGHIVGIEINADKAFIGVSGISVASGITTSVLPETAINERMMRRCQGNCYVLAARQKIGREHNFLSGTIDKIDTLITCPGASADEIKNLRTHGVEVIEVIESV